MSNGKIEEIGKSFFLNANMEEVLEESVRMKLSLETFQAWSLFKIAQSLEKIAHEGVVIHKDPEG